MNMREKTSRNLSLSKMSELNITVFPALPGPTARARKGTFGIMAVGLCLIWYSGMPFCGRTTGIRVFYLFNHLKQPATSRRSSPESLLAMEMASVSTDNSQQLQQVLRHRPELSTYFAQSPRHEPQSRVFKTPAACPIYV